MCEQHDELFGRCRKQIANLYLVKMSDKWSNDTKTKTDIYARKMHTVVNCNLNFTLANICCRCPTLFIIILPLPPHCHHSCNSGCSHSKKISFWFIYTHNFSRESCCWLITAINYIQYYLPSLKVCIEWADSQHAMQHLQICFHRLYDIVMWLKLSHVMFFVCRNENFKVMQHSRYRKV